MTETLVMEKPVSDPASDRKLILAGTKKAIWGSAHDIELIKSGTHFYCLTCLCIHPIEEQSPDPRFCWNCYDFSSQEAEALNNRTSWWVPKPAGEKKGGKTAPDKSQTTRLIAHEPSFKGDIIQDHISIPPTDQRPIMSTPRTLKNETAITTPGAAVKTRRGPKQKSLPVELIKRWAKQEGMGSKRIAARLGKECGTEVSYKTIQRILKGQRVMEL